MYPLYIFPHFSPFHFHLGIESCVIHADWAKILAKISVGVRSLFHIVGFEINFWTICPTGQESGQSIIYSDMVAFMINLELHQLSA